MRIEARATAVSWIPSEAISGFTRLPFDLGVTHYDPPPPDELDDLDELRRGDRFRFANDLQAWIEVEDGRIVGHGRAGGGVMGTSTVRLGSRPIVFEAVGFPLLRPEPEVGETSVRFVQTAGGRAGFPAPRRVRRPPFVQLRAPTVWTTLALTLDADGSSRAELVGASSFPRHWVYDGERGLVAKTGVTDFPTWYRTAFGGHTPWGDEDSPAVVAMAESALERELSAAIMRAGTKPTLRRLDAGATLVEQDSLGEELYLVLDGVLDVIVDGETVAEVGPGAVVGERAILAEGRRTSTLRAVTPVRVAEVTPDQVEREHLHTLAGTHRREEERER